MSKISAYNADRKNVNTRVEWLDFIRSLAIIAVVACHAVENVFYNDIYRMQSPSQTVRLFALSMHAVGRMGVPLFLFLTGYLLLDRKYDTASDIVHFWKTKLVPLIITYELWILIYEIYNILFNDYRFDLEIFIRKMCFLEETGWSHMWYMPMIIGIYLMLPLISFLLKAFSSKLFLIPALICFFYCFILPNLNVIFPAYDITLFKSTLSLDFTGKVYGLYLVCGYFMKKIIVRIISSVSGKKLKAFIACLFLLSAISFVGTVAFNMHCLSKEIQYDLWYNFSLLFVGTLCLFCGIGLLFFDRKIPLSRVWNRISLSAMGIYFIHAILVVTFSKTKLFNIPSLPRSVRFMLFAVVCFALSFLISELLARIPYASKLLLLRKRPSKSK